MVSGSTPPGPGGRDAPPPVRAVLAAALEEEEARLRGIEVERVAAEARVAALRSGQVDLIDTLPPDVIPSLKSAGFVITSNTYPHTWLWRLNFSPGSPFSDVRIRKAANLAIDRGGIVDFLSGTASPAVAFAPPGSAWLPAKSKKPLHPASGWNGLSQARFMAARPNGIG